MTCPNVSGSSLSGATLLWVMLLIINGYILLVSTFTS